MDVCFGFGSQEMKRIFLVRHGVTTLTQERRYCGVSNARLSSRGIRQSECLAGLLSDEKFTSIYTSPLERCLETTGPVARSHDIRPEPVAGLSEIDFGLWEGLTFEEIQAGYGERLKEWFDKPDDFIFPEGESVCDFRGRVLRSLDTILNGQDQGDLLIVAHGGSIRVIICHLCGWGMGSLHSFEIAPAGLTIMEHYEESTVVSVLNDTCHLKGEAA